MTEPITRRTMLRRAAAGAAVAWTTPVILSANTPVGAATGSACSPTKTQKWKAFDFGAVGTIAVNRNRDFGPAGGFVDVTDAYHTGDVFTIAQDGTTCGNTSAAPPLGGGVWTDDPDVAYADARWSSGRFWMPAGVHTITISVAVTPTGSGGAFWRWGRC